LITMQRLAAGAAPLVPASLVPEPLRTPIESVPESILLSSATAMRVVGAPQKREVPQVSRVTPLLPLY
jgi:hypothetical protein